jgi:transketolase N-terminal domain/subunit
MAARNKGSAGRALVLLDEAEHEEESTWEIVRIAAHERLSDFIVILNLN